MPATSSNIKNWQGDLLALHRANPERYPFLLESVSGGPHGDYDILFAFPGEVLTLAKDGSLSGPDGYDGKFLDAFDRWWRELKTDVPGHSDVPFHGGWFIYLGYELAGEIEPKLKLAASPDPLPVATAVRIPAAIIVNRNSGETDLVTETGEPELLARMAEDLLAASVAEPAGIVLPPMQPLEDEPEAFVAGVRRILDYIVEGDVFQVNLSRQWKLSTSEKADASDLYARLRRRNPGPFNGLARIDGSTLISSSPERLVSVRGALVETRPIAGTRPRGATQRTDESLSRELLIHPKERAEHIMLIDLERNDLGRICRPGSIEVNELMSLESYAHVHHIVSNVRGELVADTTPGEVIRAVFPGGTITGCPKVRCMEIIAELEGTGRGPYTGSMGYINRDGSLDLNILIRTMVGYDDIISFRAGAGIVADSDPEAELEETRAKARGLLLALEQSENENG